MFLAKNRNLARFEIFTAVTINNPSSGMLRRLLLVRAHVKEESIASIIRKLGKTLAVTGKYRNLSLRHPYVLIPVWFHKEDSFAIGLP
jgi:hypothetical protein